MKKTVFLIVGIMFVLLFGCLSPSKSMDSKSALGYEINNSIKYNLTSSDFSSGGNEQLSTLLIYSKNISGQVQFPLVDYDGEFDRVDLASDSFVRINNTSLKGLDSGEELWITPYIRGNNRTVLFNAIYSRNVTPNSDNIVILGRNYSVSKLSEKSSGAFELDDKWKVRIEGECKNNNPVSSYCDFKPVRAVIFLDGYMSDLKEGEQVNLFRNDNSVLLEFDNINSNPTIKMVYTKPVSSFSNQPTAYFDHYDYPPYNFTERQTVTNNGTRITFSPSLNFNITTNASSLSGAIVLDRVPIKIKDQTFYITDFTPNQSITLSHEKSYSKLYTRGCADQISPDPNDTANPTYVLIVGGHDLVLQNFGYSCDYPATPSVSFLVDTQSIQHLSEDRMYQFGNESVKFWHYLAGETYCSGSIYASIIDKTIELSSRAGVELKWNNSNLEEIFIPNNANLSSASITTQILSDIYSGNSYQETQIGRSKGIEITFDPAIPVCSGSCNEADRIYFGSDYTHLHNFSIFLNNQTLEIVRLQAPTTSSLILGKKFADYSLSQTETFDLGNRTFIFLYVSALGNNTNLYVICPMKNSTCDDQKTYYNLTGNQLLKIDDYYVRFTYSNWVGQSTLSVYSGIYNLSDPKYNISLTFEDQNSSNPKLRSIFIPNNSSIFE